MKLLCLIIFASSLFVPDIVYSKTKKKKSQIARVQVDGAAVYKVPNFDAPIISYLKKGQKIRASKKIYQGIGGLGTFYKVRLEKKKYGYITDADLFPNKKKSGSLSQESAGNIFTPSSGEGRLGSAMGSMGMGAAPPNGGIASKRYIGLSYNMVNYSETILETVYTEALNFFGVKVSGPKALFVDLPLELNILFYSGPPTYYVNLFESAQGFTVIADLLMIYPLMNKLNYMFYTGAGPSITFSNYLISIDKSGSTTTFDIDNDFANLGLSAVLGLGIKLGKSLAAKAEGKYVYDGQSQLIFGMALQMSY